MLQAHPDWGERYPWRILACRDEDIRRRENQAAMEAEEHEEFVQAMEGVEEAIFREVMDLEVARRRRLIGTAQNIGHRRLT